MAHFIVSYDLHNQRNYKPVWDRLESWGAVRLLESLWLVTMNATAVQIRDSLNTVIDNDDSTAVVEIKAGSMWATMRAQQPGMDWLKKNIP